MFSYFLSRKTSRSPGGQNPLFSREILIVSIAAIIRLLIMLGVLVGVAYVIERFILQGAQPWSLGVRVIAGLIGLFLLFQFFGIS